MATASQQDLEYQADLDRSRREAVEEEAPSALDRAAEAWGEAGVMDGGDDEVQAEAGLNMARAAAMQQRQAMQQAQAGEMARAEAVDQDNKDSKKTNKAFRQKLLAGLVKVMWQLNPLLFFQLTYALIAGYYGRWGSRFFRDTIPLPELGGEFFPWLPKIARIGPKIGLGVALFFQLLYALFWSLIIGMIVIAVVALVQAVS